MTSLHTNMSVASPRFPMECFAIGTVIEKFPEDVYTVKFLPNGDEFGGGGQLRPFITRLEGKQLCHLDAKKHRVLFLPNIFFS